MPPAETLAAARCALEAGVGSNLAGGTHHAFPDRGEGFCVLNDVAIAIRVLMNDGLINRAAIVDCDVPGERHAAIFEGDPSVYTFSMHGAKNYPLFKERSTVDVELPDGTGDEEYLQTLSEHLFAVFAHQPDILFYLAGADPYVNDKLGRLALTMQGLRRRDELVLSQCRQQSIPIVTVLSGGYAADINDTVEIHCNTIRAVRSVYSGCTGERDNLSFIKGRSMNVIIIGSGFGGLYAAIRLQATGASSDASGKARQAGRASICL
ncbi:MAG: hypothetical protein WKF84_29550 [Pyrinomonadaceae bacterium]